MRKTFKYHQLWVMMLGCLLITPIILYIIFKISTLSLSNDAAFVIDTCIIYLFFYTYCKLTTKYNWYTYDGEYWAQYDNLVIQKHKSKLKIKFDDIDEIFITKRNYIGCHAILIIKYGKKKLKFISPPINDKTELNDTQFMAVSNLIENNAKHLQTVNYITDDQVIYCMKRY